MAKKKETIFALLGTASVMGMHMVSGPVVGAGLGYLFDKHFLSAPYGLVGGIVLGVLAGYKNVMRDSKTLKREQEEYKKKRNEETPEEAITPEFQEYGLFGDAKKVDFTNKEKDKGNN